MLRCGSRWFSEPAGCRQWESRGGVYIVVAMYPWLSLEMSSGFCSGWSKGQTLWRGPRIGNSSLALRRLWAEASRILPCLGYKPFAFKGSFLKRTIVLVSVIHTKETVCGWEQYQWVPVSSAELAEYCCIFQGKKITRRGEIGKKDEKSGGWTGMMEVDDKRCMGGKWETSMPSTRIWIDPEISPEGD